MSWKNILKAQGIEPIIDFIKTEMVPKMGKRKTYEHGTLTDDVSRIAMKLLREGRRSQYSQVYDEEDGVSVELYIDDGFHLNIKYDPNINDLDNEGYMFGYENQFAFLKFPIYL